MTSAPSADPLLRRGSPARSVPAAALVALLRARLTTFGGFTVEHRRGRPARSGVAVCADPGLTLRFPWLRWDDAGVAGWVTRSRWAISRRTATGLCLGGWLDPASGLVWLDVVQVVPADDAGRARALAAHHAQRAVFDLDAGRVLTLGGMRG